MERTDKHRKRVFFCISSVEVKVMFVRKMSFFLVFRRFFLLCNTCHMFVLSFFPDFSVAGAAGLFHCVCVCVCVCVCLCV